jgi:hypothetical protein
VSQLASLCRTSPLADTHLPYPYIEQASSTKYSNQSQGMPKYEADNTNEGYYLDLMITPEKELRSGCVSAVAAMLIGFDLGWCSSPLIYSAGESNRINECIPVR